MSAHWNGQWPNLNSVSIALAGANVDALTATEFGILHRLVLHIAAQSVHTQFSEPSLDPRVDVSRAHIIARCSKAEWKSAESSLMPFFTRGEDGFLRLQRDDFIRLSKEAGRSAIPTDVRASVLNRDGGKCVYCGTEDGPFHYDHLWPVSRGGRNDPSNLVLACAPCNLSKADRSLLEWVAAR